MNPYSVIFLLSFFVTSCVKVSKELPNEQELLRKELHRIDWTKVDNYPSYTKCDTIKEVEAEKMCFFQYFQSDVKQKILSDSLFLSHQFKKIDTLLLEVVVLPNATIEMRWKTSQENEKLKSLVDSVLFSKTATLEEVLPATKRGVQVKSVFEMKIPL